VVLRPNLDTRRGGGEAIGLKTFDGVVIAATPSVVRLHQGNGKPRIERPRLDPAQ
jgi:20S proteasome alpha/beta subunit